ncbi:MAG: alanyl-tRNA editing protein [Candidatus Thorarchaeota archaeon]
MTELLHMHDNYTREFEAKIIEVGDKFVVLDRTAFYPEGGGQVGDQGIIVYNQHDLKVTTAKKQDGVIRHLIDGDFQLEAGTSVKGILDWERRYECMRFHTAQHILSRYLQLHYDAITVGNQITPGKSRADFSPLESFDESMKTEVEKGVNKILLQDNDVIIKFMPRADAIDFLGSKGYQVRYLEMVPKSVKEFRVISIGGYDAASCAGTHVANTKEIGAIKIGKSKNVGAGKRRIYFTLVK